MELNKAIKERKSVRKFSTKKVDWREIIEAIDYARLAPLAGNIPTIKFIIVDNKEKIKKLTQASQQDFFSNVQYVVVVCSDKTQCVRSYDERGDIYARQQAGSLIQNFLLKITELGLATCWVGAFYDTQVKQLLNIPDNIDVEAFFPIGYELGKSKQEKKPDLDKLLFFNKWNNRYMKPLIKPGA